jgi:hypothetical protein
VGEPVGAVLPGKPQGEGVESFAKKFGQGLADEALITVVMESVGKRLGQTQAMIGLADEQDTGVGGKE